MNQRQRNIDIFHTYIDAPKVLYNLKMLGQEIAKTISIIPNETGTFIGKSTPFTSGSEWPLPPNCRKVKKNENTHLPCGD